MEKRTVKKEKSAGYSKRGERGGCVGGVSAGVDVDNNAEILT